MVGFDEESLPVGAVCAFIRGAKHFSWRLNSNFHDRNPSNFFFSTSFFLYRSCREVHTLYLYRDQHDSATFGPPAVSPTSYHLLLRWLDFCRSVVLPVLPWRPSSSRGDRVELARGGAYTPPHLATRLSESHFSRKLIPLGKDLLVG